MSVLVEVIVSAKVVMDMWVIGYKRTLTTVCYDDGGVGDLECGE